MTVTIPIAAPCDSFAPGRALPHDECERCHFQRHEHLPEHRNTPGSRKTAPEPQPAGTFLPKAEPPKAVFCRQCGAGLIIAPPANPDTHPCPKCGHDGPKSGHPSIPIPDENARNQAAPSIFRDPAKITLAPGLAEIAAEHNRQRYVDFDEVPESVTLPDSGDAAPKENSIA